jgi:hypothetical protein
MPPEQDALRLRMDDERGCGDVERGGAGVYVVAFERGADPRDVGARELLEAV